jgi:hypothetical protein
MSDRKQSVVSVCTNAAVECVFDIQQNRRLAAS